MSDSTKHKITTALGVFITAGMLSVQQAMAGGTFNWKLVLIGGVCAGIIAEVKYAQGLFTPVPGTVTDKKEEITK